MGLEKALEIGGCDGKHLITSISKVDYHHLEPLGCDD